MNPLRHYAEFAEILADYHCSDEALKILRDTKLVLLTGPSASGRNTIINDLLRTGGYHFIISDTTRQPRVNNGIAEQNGVEYWFRSEEEMLDDLRQGHMLEAEILHGRQVSGISVRELKKAHDDNRVAINDVDIGGIEHLIAAKPETVAILVIPPSFDEWLGRLTARSKMTDEEIHSRMQTGLRIFQTGLADKRLNIVINDDIGQSVAAIQLLAHHGRTGDRTVAEKLLRQLSLDTKKYLKIR